REIHRGDVGALGELDAPIALTIGKKLRDLLRQVRQMDEAAKRGREARLEKADQPVERRVAEIGSGRAREPRRYARLEQRGLDRAQRQAGAYRRAAIGLDRSVGEADAVIVGNLEIEQIQPEAL